MNNCGNSGISFCAPSIFDVGDKCSTTAVLPLLLILIAESATAAITIFSSVYIAVTNNIKPTIIKQLVLPLLLLQLRL